MSFDRDKPYNDLPRLPPSRDIETKAILKQLAGSSRALAALKMVGRLLPNQILLINNLILLEAKDSSEIENIFTTHDKLYQSELFDEESGGDASTKEVKRYKEALWQGAKAMRRRALSTNVFLEIVQTIKSNQNGIRNAPGTQIKNPFGEIIYTPPVGEDRIRGLLKNLEDFIHDDEDVDPLIKMAVIHYQFEAIHPFTDGNGRTGRILNILYLLEAGLLETPVLFLSRYIIENKMQYYKGLQNVTEHDDWESWILYMLKAVEATALATIDRVESIKALMSFFSEKVKNELSGIYSKDLIELLFENPYCRIQQVADKMDVSRQTASSYLAKLDGAGLMAKAKIGKEVLYVNSYLIKELGKNS